MDRGNSKPTTKVRLRCPVTNGDFEFDAPQDGGWLAAHWTRMSKIKCRECGGAQSYSFSGVIIENALNVSHPNISGALKGGSSNGDQARTRRVTIAMSSISAAAISLSAA